jgi:MoaD family protein
MMEIKVSLLATFKLIARISEFTLSLEDGASIRIAIDQAVERYPVLRPHWLNERGELHAHVHVFLNGNDTATLPDGLATSLKAGDELIVMPPVVGG